MQKYYNQGGCPIHGHVQLANNPKPPKTGIGQDAYNGIAKSVNGDTIIQKDLFNFTRDNLNAAIEKVHGNPRYDMPEFAQKQKLQRNAARFAGYKSAWQTSHIRETKKPEELEALNKAYNTNYMQTEYVHTVRSTRAAKNWQKYEQDADLYPALEYMPSVAADPRAEHMKFYGVIKDLNEPFWDTWMPPSDWGCQCSVQQRRSTKGSNPEPDNVKLPPKAMRNNPGKTAEIFTDGHPMIGKLAKEDRAIIDREYGRLERQVINKEVQALAKTTITNSSFNTKDGTKVNVSGGAIDKMLSQNQDANSRSYLKELPAIISNLKKWKPAEKPIKNRRNINNVLFFKTETETSRFEAVVWELNGSPVEYMLHALRIKNKP